MGQGSRWASVLYPLTESNWQWTARKKQTAGSKWAKSQDFCYLPPEKVKLTVSSKKETNSRVKMGQGSRWDSVIYPLKESKWGKGHYGLLLFTLWQSETSNEQQERNKQQGQNGQRIKMGFYYLPHERVKMGLLLFTTWQSQTNSEQQERNKQKGQNGQRVKMGQGSRWASVLYPLTESN